MHHYTYRITNIKLNKHYYGTRTSKCHPSDDLGIKYFSSSSNKNFILDQKLNSKDYKYKVVKIFSTRKEALELEIKLHNKFNVGINESFYNRCKQTSTGFDTTGTIRDVNSLKNQRDSVLGKRQSKEHISKRMNATKDTCLKRGYFMSNSGKKKLSSIHKNKTISETHKKIISKCNKQQIHTLERRKLMSLKMSGTSNPMYGKKNTDEMKRINSEKNSGENNTSTYMIDVFDNNKNLIETINYYTFKKSDTYPVNALMKTKKFNSVIGDKVSRVLQNAIEWKGWHIRNHIKQT